MNVTQITELYQVQRNHLKLSLNVSFHADVGK